VVDSHTAGEPTRVIIEGGPDLGTGPLAERLQIFKQKFDNVRSAAVNEPRGSDVLVGALLTPPLDPASAAGIIFFNNAGYLGMCGHGAIGVVATLKHLGKIGPGRHVLETPVGSVTAVLSENGDVAIENVPAYRYAANVPVTVPGVGVLHGDIAWGGNWFFLVNDHGQELHVKHAAELTEYTWKIRLALEAAGITGAEGALIDHIELFSHPEGLDADSQNFVLCPGKAYDRSPCGTGTSAKLACLFADGKILEGQLYTQAGILGSAFVGSVAVKDGQIVPTIRGRAYVNAEATLLLNPEDPFCDGIRVL
jgi:4-hydroxyproline epimerase